MIKAMVVHPLVYGYDITMTLTVVPLNNVTILQATPRDPLVRNRDGLCNDWACPNYMAIHPLKEPIEFHHLYNKNKISV